MNRLIQTVEPDPDGDGGPLSSPVTTMDYDERGNISAITDARNSQTRFEYDELDRAVTRIDADPDGIDGPLASPITRFDYDANGNLVSVVDPLGTETSNEFDARNRLVSFTDADGGVTDLRYDNSDNPISLTDPAGNLTQYVYDERNRLTSEIDPIGNAFKWQYDLADNLTQQTDRNERITQYSYDDLDRLVTETWVNVDETVANVITTQYDSANNILSVVDTFSSLTFTYDALNRAIQITQSGPGVSDKRVDISYNEIGQFASIDRYSDLAGNQLVVTTAYSYDALDRRISKSVDDDPTDAIDAAITHFVYDGQDVILDFVDADGTGGADPVLDKRYLHGPAIDQVLAQEDAAGTALWYLADHLGTIRELVDDTGVVVNHFKYDSFGNVLEQSNGLVTTRYLFTGREYDFVLGLYYYRARFYDASTGRFISEDPIGFSGNDVNTYRYVANNPVRGVDPFGLQASCPKNNKTKIDKNWIKDVGHNKTKIHAGVSKKQQLKNKVRNRFTWLPNVFTLDYKSEPNGNINQKTGQQQSDVISLS